jgi:hypothetical protein
VDPRAGDIDPLLREGSNPRDLIPGQLPTAQEMQRHVAEEHDVSRPPGWWSSIEQRLRERGISLDDRRSPIGRYGIDGSPKPCTT